MLQSSLNFLVVQVGLCTFQYDENKSGYLCRAYNFFICPRQTVRGAPDRMFLCQASSLQFLSEHGFDFNKVFAHGISYLRPAEMQFLTEELEARHALQRDELAHNGAPQDGRKSSKVAIPQDLKKFVDDILLSVEGFLKGDPNAVAGESKESKEEKKEEDEALHLPECDNFSRKLIYQEVKEKYGDELDLQTKVEQGGKRHVVVKRLGPLGKGALLEERQQHEMEQLEGSRGFSQVLEAIAQSSKLVVGHNMTLDVLHLLSQFVDDLPKDYQSFKGMAKAAFPCLVDTKLLASDASLRDSFSSTMLSALLSQLKSRPSCVPPIEFVPGYGYDTETVKLHEAGYDAYITGLCFAGLCQQLGHKGKSSAMELNARSAVLKPYLNRLYLMQSADVPSLDLDRDEAIPSRGHVLHVTFPKAWKTVDLINLFQSFGHVNIHWIDDTHALVALASNNQAHKAVKKLRSQQAGQQIYRVQTYNDFARSEAPATQDVDEEPFIQRKRKRSSPPESDEEGDEDTSEKMDSAKKMTKIQSPPRSLPESTPKPLLKSEELSVKPKMFEENDDWS